VHNWEYNLEGRPVYLNLNLILFGSAALCAVLLFLIFHPDIVNLTQQSPILINIMFAPSFVIGFIYGLKITERVLRPSEIRNSIKRSIVKLSLFFFVIGGLFSSVNFALNGGGMAPDSSLLEDGLFEWFNDIISNNGGATFLVVSSITLMAAATKKIVGMGGRFNRMFTFVGTFVFFSMISLSFSQGDPTNSEVYLYTFYQAGIIGGALFQMNRLTANYNAWENFANEHL